MRVKQHDDQIKIPALPQDAANCRSFRNAVFLVGVANLSRMMKARVFRWINRCNISEDGKEFKCSKDFPILDRKLGAKLLESAKSTKFALEFPTHQEVPSERPAAKRAQAVVDDLPEVSTGSRQRDRIIATSSLSH